MHQIYQCTEGFLAATCPYGTLHLNEDLIAIEQDWIDNDKTRFMPIITDFNRISQPIIRYKLNDILTTAKQPCPCGSSFLAIDKIEGRCDDIFLLPNTKSAKKTMIFPDFISRCIISCESIEEYYVKQHCFNKIEVSIKTNGNTQEQSFEDIKKSFAQLFNKLQVKQPEIHFTDNFPKVSATKRKRVERLF